MQIVIVVNGQRLNNDVGIWSHCWQAYKLKKYFDASFEPIDG